MSRGVWTAATDQSAPGSSAVGDEPFIGSEAISAGTLTRHELRKYHRAVMPDVYVGKWTHLSPATTPARPRVAVVTSAGGGRRHFGGDTARRQVDRRGFAPVELIWPNARPPRGVITRHDTVLADETQTMHGDGRHHRGADRFRPGPQRPARRMRLPAWTHSVRRPDSKADVLCALLPQRHPHTRGLSPAAGSDWTCTTPAANRPRRRGCGCC